LKKLKYAKNYFYMGTTGLMLWLENILLIYQQKVLSDFIIYRETSRIQSVLNEQYWILSTKVWCLYSISNSLLSIFTVTLKHTWDSEDHDHNFIQGFIKDVCISVLYNLYNNTRWGFKWHLHTNTNKITQLTVSALVATSIKQ
jgi:hypothetical protein